MKIRKTEMFAAMLFTMILAFGGFFLRADAGDNEADETDPVYTEDSVMFFDPGEEFPISSPEEEEGNGEKGSLTIREDILYDLMSKIYELIREWSREKGEEFRLSEGLSEGAIGRASELYLMNGGTRPNGTNDFFPESVTALNVQAACTWAEFWGGKLVDDYDCDAIAKAWFDEKIRRLLEQSLDCGCTYVNRDIGLGCVRHRDNGFVCFFYIGVDHADELVIPKKAEYTERRIDFYSNLIRFETIVPDTLKKGKTADIRILALSINDRSWEIKDKKLEAQIDGITFSSDNEAVVSVSDTGRLKALKAGTAVITVSAPGYGTKEFTVTVPGNADPLPPAPEVEIEAVDAGTAAIAVKQKLDISGAAAAAVSENYRGVLRYVSDNKQVAGVSAKGLVKGKKAGSATIKIYGDFSGRSVLLATYSLLVTKPVLKFTEDLNYVHDTLDLNAFITGLPEGQPIRWSIPSSAKAAYLSDDSGTITALKNGSIKVSCIIGEGKNAASCSATLKVRIPKTPNAVKMKEGKYKTVTLNNVSPYTDVQWSVDENTCVLITEQPKNNKVRLHSVCAGDTILRAVVDGQEYLIPVTVK